MRNYKNVANRNKLYSSHHQPNIHEAVDNTNFNEFFDDVGQSQSLEHAQQEYYGGADLPEEIAHFPEWQEIYEEGGSIQQAMRTVFPEMQSLSDEEVESQLYSIIENMSPEEQEGFFNSLGKVFKKVVKTVAPFAKAAAPIIKTVAPIVGGAIGTAYGVPTVGASLGNITGNIAGNALSNIPTTPTHKRIRRSRRRRARKQRTSRTAYTTPRPPYAGASSSLLNLMQNPQIQQALLGIIRGGSAYRSPAGETVAAEVIVSAIQEAALATLKEMDEQGLGVNDSFLGLREEHFENSEQMLPAVLEMMSGENIEEGVEREFYEY